jgi:RNA polymerase sigma-70 factor, ECF subfamily
VVGDSWLAPLFLADLDPALRGVFATVSDEELEGVLANAFDAGCRAWPTISVDSSSYVRHLAAVVAYDGGPPQQALASLHAPDLYLAYACAYGHPQAVAIVDHDIIGQLDSALLSMGLDASSADEVKQRMRELLFVGVEGIPGITSYRGQGRLRSWLRAIALRQAMRWFRDQRGTKIGDDALHAIPAISEDPQLGPWKHEYAAAFRAAFEASIAALDRRDRNLLRQHHIDGLSVDALAKLHRVHRATAARWVAAAREALLAGVRERVVEQLGISGTELESAFRLARSQLDLSVHRLLGKHSAR